MLPAQGLNWKAVSASCHAMPADQLMGCKTDRHPLQTTVAQNGTPLAATLSAISEHSTQLTP